MRVSCKVSYSVLVYVERQGVQLEAFFEGLETPIELLKDPACWIEVSKMEEFLQKLALHVGDQTGGQYFREIGRQNFELRAWGVLDSVLKMVESPKDIFSQPDRFLSYFLTPHPELVFEHQGDHKIAFRFEKRPTSEFVFSYLMGAVEGLPLYMGMPHAMIEEINSCVFEIKWFDDQQSLFDEQERRRRQLHPEIVQSVMQSFQERRENLQQPEQIASEAFEQMVAVEVEKRMEQWLARQQDFDQSFLKIKDDFYKMYDYFTRAQQIITLVSPTARKASVREAMRRVDWEHVQKEFPRMVESACETILSMKDAIHDGLVQDAVGTESTEASESDSAPETPSDKSSLSLGDQANFL